MKGRRPSLWRKDPAGNLEEPPKAYPDAEWCGICVARIPAGVVHVYRGSRHLCTTCAPVDKPQ